MPEKLGESFLLLAVGMTGVFVSLLLLACMIWIFRVTDEWLNRKRIQKYSEQLESQHVLDDINDELVAVLSAAASSVIKKAIKVRRIHFLGDTDSTSWASTGRLNIMASHLIPKGSKR